MSEFRLAVIGDLHSHWDNVDIAQFSNSDYDLLFFTGDLGGGTPESSMRVARAMSQLARETLVMPGNNDTVDIGELAAELNHRSGLGKLAALKRGNADAPASINLCGYSSHRVQRDTLDITLIAARPHSMGGPNLSFADYMEETYGVADMEASTARLLRLVEEAESDKLLFLAHNGPTGLGENPEDMWGCDFKPGGGDWGDPDLSAAMQHAVALGKQVLGIIGGHMHLKTKCGQERPWSIQKDGIWYVNAARVPRIFSGKDDVYRHHVSVVLTADGISVEEVLVPEYG